jgi:aminomethyltransferase
MTGYQALRQAAAFIDLGPRGCIYVFGDDRARLLHAMTTNHIQQMQPGQTLYAFFLTAQGRIIADVNVLCLGDAFVLDTEPETRATVFEHLDKYIIADDVTLEDRTGQVSVFAIEGPTSADALRSAGITAVPEPNQWTPFGSGIAAGISATAAPAVRFFLPPAEAAQIRAQLALPEATADEWNTVRVENAHPRYGVDFTASQIPHETQLLHAVHFSKGCYLGQEIVERVRSRGHANRKLVQLEIDGAATPDAKVMMDGKEVGALTSAYPSPTLGKHIGLGYLRAEALTGKSSLTVGEALARVTDRTPH